MEINRRILCILLVSMLITPALASDWSMFKKDISHSGFTSDPVNPPFVLKWNVSLGFDTDSSPVVVNDVLYVGSNYGIHAFDIKTGKQLFSFRTNGFVKSVPTVADGILYIGADDRRFYAIDTKDGSLKWIYANVTGGFTASAFVMNDLVYIGSKDGSFYALNINDGSLSWKKETGKGIESSATIDEGTIAFGTNGGYLMGLDASNGNTKWIYETGIIDIKSSPAAANGIMFIGSNSGTVYAMNISKGILKWTFSTRSNVESSPSYKNGIVYVGSKDTNFYALDERTGAVKWQFQAAGYVDSSPAISNDIVYFGSKSNILYALDANTGKLLWKTRTGEDQNDFITSPALSGNMLFTVTHSGYVHAYSSGTDAMSTPAAATPARTVSETAAAPAVTQTPAAAPVTTSVTTSAPTAAPAPVETKKTPGFEFSVVLLFAAMLVRKKFR